MYIYIYIYIHKYTTESAVRTQGGDAEMASTSAPRRLVPRKSRTWGSDFGLRLVPLRIPAAYAPVCLVPLRTPGDPPQRAPPGCEGGGAHRRGLDEAQHRDAGPRALAGLNHTHGINGAINTHNVCINHVSRTIRIIYIDVNRSTSPSAASTRASTS